MCDLLGVIMGCIVVDRDIYRPQTKFAKVMFSQVFICPRGGKSLSGGSLSGGSMFGRGESLSGGSLSGRLPVW